MKSAMWRLRTKLKCISSLVNFLISASSGGSNGVWSISREKIDDVLLFKGLISLIASPSSKTEDESCSVAAGMIFGESVSFFMDLVTLEDIVLCTQTDIGQVLSFLGGWDIGTPFWLVDLELFVRDDLFSSVLQTVDPRVTNTIGELFLLSP
ncbi:hypothetical protein WICPIJ_008756 [Wickerhamomyces pijperi]|uniref:Uncharacterized protein n=1 Tax=Wickerhamomyces pijperi TaxID=599730 RepID=A0A9P8PVA2_WICPI|nr:hypothetical protein WICPIJ_008756 [Wickerhamomyces pijperi]